MHSRYDQLIGFVKGVVKRGAKRVRVHVLTDGRDVPDGTSKKFVTQLQVPAAGGCSLRLGTKRPATLSVSPHGSSKPVLLYSPGCPGSPHLPLARPMLLHDEGVVLQDDLAAVSKDGVSARIASGGGRMCVTMDRYEVPLRFPASCSSSSVPSHDFMAHDPAKAAKHLDTHHITCLTVRHGTKQY